VTDAILVLLCLFGGLTCEPACGLDADADGSPSAMDALYLLRYLFERGEAPRECP
jgi:hypothetical protein